MGETINLTEEISIGLVSSGTVNCKLSIVAPKHISIVRSELLRDKPVGICFNHGMKGKVTNG